MLSNRKTFKKGEIIVREGTPGNSAYILESGRVAVSRGAGSQRLQIAELGPGAIFGEMCLIDDSPRSATVAAVDDSLVTVLGKAAFQQALNKLPPAVMKIVRMMADRLRDTDILINPLKLNNFYFSLCRLLLCLARGEGQRSENGEVSLDHQKLVEDCCTILALDKETVDKVLNRLAFTRLVRLEKTRRGDREVPKTLILSSLARFSEFVTFLQRNVADNAGPPEDDIEIWPDKTLDLLRVLNENVREFQGAEGRVNLPLERALQAAQELLGSTIEECREFLQPLIENATLSLAFEPGSKTSLLVCLDKARLLKQIEHQADLRTFTKMVQLLKNLA